MSLLNVSDKTEQVVDIWTLRKTHWIVIPVNLVGIMGRGLAHQFKTQYPRGYMFYKNVCDTYKGEPERILGLRDGGLLVYEEIRQGERHCFLMFPVKYHWQDEAQLDMIDRGLYFLSRMIPQISLWSNRTYYGALSPESNKAEVLERGKSIVSPSPVRVALPHIGCGFGELTWDQVKPLVDKYLNPYSGYVSVIAPDPELQNKYADSFKPGWRKDRSMVEANLGK